MCIVVVGFVVLCQGSMLPTSLLFLVICFMFYMFCFFATTTNLYTIYNHLSAILISLIFFFDFDFDTALYWYKILKANIYVYIKKTYNLSFVLLYFIFCFVLFYLVISIKVMITTKKESLIKVGFNKHFNIIVIFKKVIFV